MHPNANFERSSYSGKSFERSDSSSAEEEKVNWSLLGPVNGPKPGSMSARGRGLVSYKNKDPKISQSIKKQVSMRNLKANVGGLCNKLAEKKK